jgi:uncharacterized protein (UPF0333 family)
MKDKAPFFVFLLLVIVAGIGFGYYSKDIECSKVTSISGLECYRLYLAFGVLFAVAVMLAIAAAFYTLIPAPAQGDHPGKLVFDTMSKSLLPVVTLVLGYYFGSSQPAGTATKEKPPGQSAAVAPASTGASAAKGK